MTDAAVLLDKLTALGVNVSTDGDKLRLRPASVIPDGMMAEAKALKPELIALLAANDTAAARHVGHMGQDKPIVAIPAYTGARARVCGQSVPAAPCAPPMAKTASRAR